MKKQFGIAVVTAALVGTLSLGFTTSASQAATGGNLPTLTKGTLTIRA